MHSYSSSRQKMKKKQFLNSSWNEFHRRKQIQRNQKEKRSFWYYWPYWIIPAFYLIITIGIYLLRKIGVEV